MPVKPGTGAGGGDSENRITPIGDLTDVRAPLPDERRPSAGVAAAGLL
jgi:hypothetical protein